MCPAGWWVVAPHAEVSPRSATGGHSLCTFRNHLDHIRHAYQQQPGGLARPAAGARRPAPAAPPLRRLCGGLERRDRAGPGAGAHPATVGGRSCGGRLPLLRRRAAACRARPGARGVGLRALHRVLLRRGRPRRALSGLPAGMRPALRVLQVRRLAGCAAGCIRRGQPAASVMRRLHLSAGSRAARSCRWLPHASTPCLTGCILAPPCPPAATPTRGTRRVVSGGAGSGASALAPPPRGPDAAPPAPPHPPAPPAPGPALPRPRPTGSLTSSKALAQKLERVQPYLAGHGTTGGITISGGEPLLQVRPRGRPACLAAREQVWLPARPAPPRPGPALTRRPASAPPPPAARVHRRGADGGARARPHHLHRHHGAGAEAEPLGQGAAAPGLRAVLHQEPHPG